MKVGRLTQAIVVIFIVYFGIPSAQAYVTYNRLGYVSCSACHYDPTGGGVLTPYGQGVQSAMALFPGDGPADSDGKRINQGVQARVLGLNPSGQRANPFLMQADYLGDAFITKTIHMDVQLGPNLQQGISSIATIPSGWDGLVVRRALVTDDLESGDSIEVGRDEPASGLNIDDHTALLRSANRRGIYDYPTQLRYIRQTEQYQLMPYFLAPSYEESNANQEYGGGARAEYLLNNSNSVGLGGQFANAPAQSRVTANAFARLSHDHWNGLAAEYVFNHYSVHDSGTSFAQHDLYLKPYIAVPEWIETGFVMEYLNVASPFEENVFQYGPSVNIRLYRMVSLLGDGRNLTSNGSSNWSWYGQVFLHWQI